MTTANSDGNALINRLEFYAAMGRAGNFNGAALRVAFVLLYRHMNGNTGRCDPAIATLAEETGLSRRGVIYAIDELEQSGWWTVERNAGTAGRGGRPNAYQPNLEGGAKHCTPSDGKEVQSTAPLNPERGAKVGTKEVQHFAPKPRKNLQQQDAHAREGVCEDSSLEEFWRTYPSRAPHPNPQNRATQKFLEALRRGVDPAVIIRGARNYARYVDEYVSDPQRIAYAANWLEQERWNDHQQLPERPRMRVGLV